MSNSVLIAAGAPAKPISSLGMANSTIVRSVEKRSKISPFATAVWPALPV
jgi:hypothetical protein